MAKMFYDDVLASELVDHLLFHYSMIIPSGKRYQMKKGKHSLDGKNTE